MAESTVNDLQDVEDAPSSYTSTTPGAQGAGTSIVAPGGATGRRKQAVARVRIAPGSGQWTINGRTLPEYFPNKALTGTAASVACEPAPLNHDWGMGSPVGVGPDNFSARWSGSFDFATNSTYTFNAVSDDGVRVWVDGVLLIDQWRDQSPTTFTASRALTAGRHDVKMEWFETGYGAVAKLGWAAGGTTVG